MANNLPTNCHRSVDDLRRDIMRGVAHWTQVADKYTPDGQNRSAADVAAYGASLMAGSYGYTLAAIIGYARRFGEDVAAELAAEADEILMNGDFEGLNKDVIEVRNAEVHPGGGA